MQINNAFNTVAKIADYTKKQVDIYRQFPSKKQEVVKSLSDIFMDVNCWGKVISENEFSSAFKQKLGKGRMVALKKLLKNLDNEHYSQVNFN